MTRVSVVVEGASDEGVARSLVAHCGLELGIMLGGNGKDAIRKKIESYNQAAKFSPWFVLVDLDNIARLRELAC
ncbi:MAG TPA: hypothetical protein VF444_11615 [Pseudonocardiaceae bacterium]